MAIFLASKRNNYISTWFSSGCAEIKSNINIKSVHQIQKSTTWNVKRKWVFVSEIFPWHFNFFFQIYSNSCVRRTFQFLVFSSFYLICPIFEILEIDENMWGKRAVKFLNFLLLFFLQHCGWEVIMNCK